MTPPAQISFVFSAFFSMFVDKKDKNSMDGYCWYSLGGIPCVHETPELLCGLKTCHLGLHRERGEWQMGNISILSELFL